MNEKTNALEEIAASWRLRLDDAAPDERASIERELRVWLDADARHADAYARAGQLWDALSHFAVEPEMLSLRSRALRQARTIARARFAYRKPLWRAMAAASFVLAALGGAAYWSFSTQSNVYQTAIAERRLVTLGDNSHVDIDADSAIAVKFSRDVRLVQLLRGQAFFQVEHDPTRPFVVEAGGRRVVATGTEFNVELVGATVQVTLVQGHVVVKPDGPDPARPTNVAELSPGDELVAAPDERPRLFRTTNIASTTSWRGGMLIFNDEPLPNAIARMERYSRIQIVLGDPSLAGVRVSGVFNAGDVTAFVGALKKAFPIDSSDDGSDAIRLTRRG